MYNIIVFAGTTEGREIAEFLNKHKIDSLICVATEYGETLLPKGDHIQISHKRLSIEEMEQLIKDSNCQIVIDATHPYAAEVTQNIIAACSVCETSYVRVLRKNIDCKETDCALFVNSVDEAVELLKEKEGNILATTGSKEAYKYTTIPDFQNRVFLRVLSLPNVVKQCQELGFQGKNLICMQGPFSTELNKAMIRQWNCKYLVTKMSGNTGGFLEKIEAAASCGCTLVIVGRPLVEEGITVMECKKMLCEKYKLTSAPHISLVGIGVGDEKICTKEAREAIKDADLLIGARRMVESINAPSKDCFIEYDSHRIIQYIKNHPEYENVVILLSGDPGFCSGAKRLIDGLNGNVQVITGISSVSYFMSKILKSWDDVVLTSSHGKNINLISMIKKNKKVFSILGTKSGISDLAKKLIDYHLTEVMLYTGECLSYPDEKIKKGKPEEFLEYEANPLSVIYVENPYPEKDYVTHGISDEEFLREKVPMTKEEVRTISLSKLHLENDSICYDVGAGTGSVSIEMANRSWNGKVYAIEKKPLAVELIQKNKEKFAVDNLEIIEGLAPDALEGLESPTHAFIGGSSGNMDRILKLLLEKNPKVRVVINCIALETVSEALQCLKTLPFIEQEIVQIATSKSKTIGNYHMMMGENPIYIISCTGAGKINQ